MHDTKSHYSLTNEDARMVAYTTMIKEGCYYAGTGGLMKVQQTHQREFAKSMHKTIEKPCY